MTEREKFEAAMLKEIRPLLDVKYLHKNDAGIYSQSWVQSNWLCWQAAKADSAAEIKSLVDSGETKKKISDSHKARRELLIIADSNGK